MKDTGKNIAKTGLMAVGMGLVAQGANVIQAEQVSGAVMIIVGLAVMFAKYTVNWYK